MSTFSVKDFNSAAYSSYRPTYPSELYEKIYSYHKSHNGSFDVALDVAAGTGQVSTVLASKFNQVYATDASSAMLENAIKKPNIIYSVSKAENLSQFSSSSVDLITTAQAAHWFEVSKFFEESSRVLKPNGTLAIWGYGLIKSRDYPRVTKLFDDYTNKEMDKYWEEGRKILDNMYREFKLPEDLFQDIKWEVNEGDETKDEILMEIEWPIIRLSDYLKTWSCYKTYMDTHPKAEDPVDRLITEILKVEGLKDDDNIRILWPTVLILAEKK